MTVRAPHPLLRRMVTPYHGYHYAGMDPGIHHGLPSTTLTVVIAFDEPLDVAWAHDDASRVKQWATAAGLHDGPALIRHDGHQHGVQFDLTPHGARSILGMPAGELKGTIIPLEEVVPFGRLYDEVAGAPDWQTRFDLLDEALLDPASRGEAVRSELAWAWQRLHRNPAQRIDALARELGWSRRHLASAFTSEYGVGPKQAARLVRFKRARDLLARGRSISCVAAETGFADQAHLTREWRNLAGCTPGEWLRSEFPFLQDEAAPA